MIAFWLTPENTVAATKEERKTSVLTYRTVETVNASADGAFYDVGAGIVVEIGQVAGKQVQLPAAYWTEAAYWALGEYGYACWWGLTGLILIIYIIVKTGKSASRRKLAKKIAAGAAPLYSRKAFKKNVYQSFRNKELAGLYTKNPGTELILDRLTCGKARYAESAKLLDGKRFTLRDAAALTYAREQGTDLDGNAYIANLPKEKRKYFNFNTAKEVYRSWRNKRIRFWGVALGFTVFFGGVIASAFLLGGFAAASLYEKIGMFAIPGVVLLAAVFHTALTAGKDKTMEKYFAVGAELPARYSVFGAEAKHTDKQIATSVADIQLHLGYALGGLQTASGTTFTAKARTPQPIPTEPTVISEERIMIRTEPETPAAGENVKAAAAVQAEPTVMAEERTMRTEPETPAAGENVSAAAATQAEPTVIAEERMMRTEPEMPVVGENVNAAETAESGYQNMSDAELAKRMLELSEDIDTMRSQYDTLVKEYLRTRAAAAEEAQSSGKETVTLAPDEIAVAEDETVTAFASKVRKTFAEALEELPKAQKAYYEDLRQYALSRENAKSVPSKNGERIKVGSKQLMAFQIRRETLVAVFDFESEEVRRIRLSQEKAVKQQPTLVRVADGNAAAAVRDMIDLMLDQLKREAEEKKAARREARKAKRAAQNRSEK